MHGPQLSALGRLRIHIRERRGRSALRHPDFGLHAEPFHLTVASSHAVNRQWMIPGGKGNLRAKPGRMPDAATRHIFIACRGRSGLVDGCHGDWFRGSGLCRIHAKAWASSLGPALSQLRAAGLGGSINAGQARLDAPGRRSGPRTGQCHNDVGQARPHHS